VLQRPEEGDTHAQGGSKDVENRNKREAGDVK
jgi:hypothetical protein